MLGVLNRAHACGLRARTPACRTAILYDFAAVHGAAGSDHRLRQRTALPFHRQQDAPQRPVEAYATLGRRPRSGSPTSRLRRPWDWEGGRVVKHDGGQGRDPAQDNKLDFAGGMMTGL